MHLVAVIALENVVPFDLATPYEVFSRAPGYEVRICGEAREVDAGGFVMRTRFGLKALEHADTIIVPGIGDISKPVSSKVIKALRAAALRGTRIASICSGAFVLAATGLLDGKRATTHWLAAAELARRFPSVKVDPDVLYVDTGQLLTSAGAAAGLDLCLHLVRRDFGATVAMQTARLSVMPLERDGGQSQFIVHAAPVEASSLDPLLHWLEKNLARALPLEDIAHHAGLSVRTLTRRFSEQLGTTPLQWLLKARVRRAQHLLESTSQSIEVVAEHSGFSSASALREHFHRVVNASPQRYRSSFRRT